MASLPRTLLSFALLALIACSSTDEPERPPDTNRVHDDHAPTPFTASEIRRGCRTGRLIRLRIWSKGKPPAVQTWRFLDDSPTDAKIEMSVADETGRDLGGPKLETVLWADLQSHASFPEAVTEITTTHRATPIGQHECWTYVVRRKGENTVERYWFSKTLPGPPIEYVREVNGEIVARQSMIETKY